MYRRPNYDTARAEAGFEWSASTNYYAYFQLANVPIRDFFLQPDACIEAYTIGRARAREILAEDRDITFAGPATPPISYGHVNGLGAELLFPEGGEVAHTHPYRSLKEGIAALRKPVDYAQAGMAPFYLDFHRKLKAAFPNEKVGFGYSLEGPITTAYELRGDEVFTDALDEPDLFKEFLRLTTASIIEFHRFRAAVNEVPAVSPDAAGMADDIASLFRPDLFPEFVVPYWDQYFTGLTTGYRHAHVENLRGPHLKHLETVGLYRFDPSISAQLNPKIISRECRVPFAWRLGDFHFADLTADEVRDWVFQAAADGASSVFISLTGKMCLEPTLSKVRSFIRAAKEAQAMLKAGKTRADVGRLVTEAGRRRFWDHWPQP